MAAIKYKPTTPGRRGMSVPSFEEVTKFTPEKSLLATKKKFSGRNSYGRITVRHKGGGNRRKYRVIDFKRNKLDAEAKVIRLEYDPNRTAYIALVEYEDGERRYIVAPNGLSVGDVVVSSANADKRILDEILQYTVDWLRLLFREHLKYRKQFVVELCCKA